MSRLHWIRERTCLTREREQANKAPILTTSSCKRKARPDTCSIGTGFQFPAKERLSGHHPVRINHEFRGRALVEFCIAIRRLIERNDLDV